jgi:S-adenosylhomocysteine hydrolase
VQALALAWLGNREGWSGTEGRGGREGRGGEDEPLPPGVHEVPPEIDAQIAALALASLGTEIDALTPAQQEYLDSWRQGS